MLANVTVLAKVALFRFINCLGPVYKFISISPPADWQTGMGPAFHWAGITLGRHCIGRQAGRPKIQREIPKCRQICDDNIPWLLFKGNYNFISNSSARLRDLNVNLAR